MNVLMIGFDHTIASAKPGGMGDARERHLKYARALRKHQPGSCLVVLTRAPASLQPEHIEEDGLIVYTLPCIRSLFLPKALRAASRLIQDRSFDLITTQTPFDDGLIGWWLKRRYRLPLNVQMRSSFLDDRNWIAGRPVIYRVFNTLGKWVASRADSLRVVSKGEKQRLEKRFPWLRGKVYFLPPLVNMKTFMAEATDKEVEYVRGIMKQSGLPSFSMVFFVGRISPEKDLPTLLRAFAILSETRPDASLVIAGNGRLRSRMKLMASRLSIRHVMWLGKVELKYLRGWYAAASVLALPSLHEGFGKVIAEAYLMGTPVVVTSFVSAEELVVDGKTGFVVPFRNEVALAAKLGELLDNGEQARAMGQQGRQHILDYLPSEKEYIGGLLEIWDYTVAVAVRSD